MYFLGIDGGGTKTDAVLTDAGGRALAESRAGGSNPLRAGFSQSLFVLKAVSADVLRAAGLSSRDIRGLCAGLAGAGRSRVAQEIQDALRAEFPHSEVRVVTDLEIALEAAAGEGPGVILVAGTGSAALGRNSEGQTARAGRWGPWISDRGSAFDIGRRAVELLAHNRDLGLPDPLLAPRVFALLGRPTWDDLVERIAAEPEAVFPPLFPAVVEAAREGDASAREILLDAAEELAKLVAAVVRRLGMADAAFTLAMSGGVFGRSELLDRRLEERIRGAAPRARVERLAASPAAGAAHLARRLCRASGAAGGRADR